MNARDELAKVIVAAYGEDAEAECPCEQDLDVADAILAAGYRKPRTITTADELDALPVGSVILYHGRAFQRAAETAGPFGEYKKWRCGDGGFVRSTKDGTSILPATVLYEPQP